MPDAIDFPALAALRPGADRSVLQAAMGAHWKQPAPHQEGMVKAMARRYGFEARLDINDRLGSAAYREPFPTDISVLGLHLEMSPDEVLAVQPKLALGFQLPIYESAHYFADLSDHYRLGAEFRWGKLYEVRLFARDAQYPPKRAMVYPLPAGKPGDPFRDPNFKLVVLSSLLENDALDLGRPRDLAEFVLQRPVDLEKEGYRLIREAYDYLVRYPLTDADLLAVDTIVFDGGNEIYPYCFYFWSGESQDFDVASIKGIALCSNLRVITDIAMAGTIDIDDLVGLTRLEEIDLSDWVHPERLLDLPALKKLSLGGAIDPEIVARLKARGVAVRASG